ncbi:Astacin-like metalloendopeptidase [Liparis tanakae]|uniref:Metalloendopeptidase n=1 Tax=Liparis tanakae TaxID=230148 RepID=A0A4Z2FGZ2_9TELE|nr:Astacin-like metalloendopeptidase [Liparis tanakae]
MLQLVLAALLLAGAQQGSCSPLRDELLSKDRTLLQGDMVVSEDRNAVTSRWPTTTIPYLISPQLASHRSYIEDAMAMLSSRTCVSFLKRRSERDYLHFVKSFGCASYVGFNGGEQEVFVGPGCLVGNIVHEILHALGFYHEHTRMDRGGYIKILYNNIMPGMELNFKQQVGETFDLSYDLSSILHYGSNYFSANGRPTIEALVYATDMGQRTRLTAKDVTRCQATFPLADILLFIEHKRKRCHGPPCLAGGRGLDKPPSPSPGLALTPSPAFAAMRGRRPVEVGVQATMADNDDERFSLPRGIFPKLEPLPGESWSVILLLSECDHSDQLIIPG